MFNEIINVLSLIVAIAALITTIIIAIHTIKITEEQGKESKNLSQLNNELTEKIHKSVEYLSPAQIEFKISNIHHPVNKSNSYIDRTINDYLFGTTLEIQSDLERHHGQVAKSYIFYKKYDGTILKRSFKDTIEIDLCNESEYGDLNYIHSHFFVIYVDSAFKIHRILVELLAKATTKAYRNQVESIIYVPTGKETHQELGQKAGLILYRTWDEFDLIENSYKQVNDKNWKNGYTNRKENLTQEELDDLEKQKFDNCKIVEEIKEINKLFNALGFN